MIKHSIRFAPDVHERNWEPILVIRVTGHTDVFRLAEVLRHAQCDFAMVGSSVQRSLRRRWGARMHDAYFHSLTGRDYRGRKAGDS